MRLETIDHSYLASAQVDTPDGRRLHPFCGEQLVISWNLPASYSRCQNLHMRVRVRLRCAETVCLRIPLKALEGWYVYRLMNEEYRKSGGILTYKVVVCDGATVLDSWTHQVWAELIRIDAES